MAAAPAKWKPKDPKDIADYKVNWRPAGQPFLPPTVTVTASTVVIGNQPTPGAGYTVLAIDDQDHTPDFSIIRFSGGSGLVDYSIDVDIDVSTGEHFNATITLPVRERIKK